MWNWTAHAAAAVVANLRVVPNVVLPRGQGRTKEQAENWVLRNLFATLASTEHFDYPIQPHRGERPDCILTTANGTIGIEVTEVMTEAYARAEVIRDREFPSVPVDPSLFRPGKAPQTSAEIRDLLRASGGRLRGRGWEGDDVETEWADAVAAAIEHKEAILNSSTFDCQSRNWLALYDNHPVTTAGLDLPSGVAKLTALLDHRAHQPVRFDTVTIESTTGLVLLTSPVVRTFDLIRC
jgi:hypothetical protein